MKRTILLFILALAILMASGRDTVTLAQDPDPEPNPTEDISAGGTEEDVYLPILEKDGEGQEDPLLPPTPSEGEMEAVTLQLEPQSAGDLSESEVLSPADREELHLRLLELRENTAAQVDNNPLTQAVEPQDETLKQVDYPETEFVEEAVETIQKNADMVEYPGPENAFIIGRNWRNSRAQLVSSTLAEPAAVNEGKNVFYMGNTHAEYSTNGGTSWTNVPIPAGPADAPTACCDPDVIYDQARGVTFWSVLYVNGSLTNGVVRIGVRHTIDGGDSCSYTIDPAGAANNILPDYPHLGLSNDYLWLTTNNIDSTGNWVGSQVYRISLDQMASCIGASGGVFTYGPPNSQRVFVPVQGARETMYWGMLPASNQFRLYWWPEWSGSISWTTKTINTSNFTNPDCRGGVGNYDFIERPTSYSIAGFRMRGAIGHGIAGANNISFYWNVGTDGSHSEGHVHGVVFRDFDRVIIGQPVIYNSGRCFGYPVVATNERGDIGLSIAAGGKAGGGGTAAQGWVGISDEYSIAVGWFGTVYNAAGGTHNRTDGRFGDYFTIHPHEPCDLFFAATSYALQNGNTLPAHVNARYVNFGRGRDQKCYTGWVWTQRAP